MSLSYSVLDVFTTTAFKGNPLAVVTVPSAQKTTLTEARKQAIATEFNLSETVFLHKAQAEDEQAEYDIFTVKARVAFAGHPTIGTAIYIKNIATADFPSIKSLRTIAGEVPITYDPTQNQAQVLVPHNIRVHAQKPPHPHPDHSPSPTLPIPIVSIVKGMSFFLVPLVNLKALATMTRGILPIDKTYVSPYLDREDGWNQGLHNTFYYVDVTDTHDDTQTTSSSPERKVRHLRTRGFGQREDPGTGSASSALCCHLALQELEEKGSGPFDFHLTQGVEMGRPCDIYAQVVRTADGKGIESVALGGTAVLVMQGQILA